MAPHSPSGGVIRARAIIHRANLEYRRTNFRSRQRDMIILTAIEVAFYAVSLHPVFGLLAILAATTGASEAWRFRLTGRYYQTWMRPTSTALWIERLP